MDQLRQLQTHVRYRLGSRVHYAKAWRTDELTRLVVRHWPHSHLEDIETAGGQNHAAIQHAMTLVRAQVRERWEATQGVGPLWGLVLADTVDGISQVLLELWWSDARWRGWLKTMAQAISEVK